MTDTEKALAKMAGMSRTIRAAIAEIVLVHDKAFPMNDGPSDLGDAVTLLESAAHRIGSATTLYQ